MCCADHAWVAFDKLMNHGGVTTLGRLEKLPAGWLLIVRSTSCAETVRGRGRSTWLLRVRLIQLRRDESVSDMSVAAGEREGIARVSACPHPKLPELRPMICPQADTQFLRTVPCKSHACGPIALQRCGSCMKMLCELVAGGFFFMPRKVVFLLLETGSLVANHFRAPPAIVDVGSDLDHAQ